MDVGEGLSGPRGGLGGQAKSKIAYCVCAQEELGVGGTDWFWVWVRVVGEWEFDLLPPLFVGKGRKRALGTNHLSVEMWVRVEAG